MTLLLDPNRGRHRMTTPALNFRRRHSDHVAMNSIQIADTTISITGCVLTVTTPAGVTRSVLVEDAKEWWQMVDCSEVEHIGDAVATEVAPAWDEATMARLHRESEACRVEMAAKVAKVRMGWDE